MPWRPLSTLPMTIRRSDRLHRTGRAIRYGKTSILRARRSGG
jgi:hypothetical protein